MPTLKAVKIRRVLKDISVPKSTEDIFFPPWSKANRIIIVLSSVNQ